MHENISSIYWHDLLHICMFNSYFDTYALNACWNSLWDAHSPKHILQRALRCAQAAVHAGERQVAKIGQGMMVLVGIEKRDSIEDCVWAANKLTNLRLWEGPEYEPWKRSVIDCGHEIILVSQVCFRECACAIFEASDPPTEYSVARLKKKRESCD